MAAYYLLFAAAILISGVLLGCVPAWMGKILLPRFGGTALTWEVIAGGLGAAVWIGTLAGFVFTRVASLRVQAVAVVLGWAAASAALALLDVAAAMHGQVWPSIAAVTVFLLAVGGILAVLPSLVAHLELRVVDAFRLDPYALLAVDFFGVSVGALGYGIVIEPWLSLTAQGLLWKVAVASIGLVLLPAVALIWRQARPRALSPGEAADWLKSRPSVWHRIHWVLLVAIPVALAFTSTSYIVTEIAPIPLLWLAAAGLPSLAYVLAFGRVDLRAGFPLAFSIAVQLVAGLGALPVALLFSEVYFRNAWDAHPVLACGSVALILLILFAVPQRWTIVLQAALTSGAIASVALAWWGIETPPGYALPLVLGALWFSCWGCTASLVCRRPVPTRIAEFYVCIAIGTPLGALMLTLMPALFPNFLYEYPLLLVLALLVRLLPPWPAPPCTDMR